MEKKSDEVQLNTTKQRGSNQRKDKSFFSFQGILLLYFKETNTEINVEYYARLLYKLTSEIKDKIY